MMLLDDEPSLIEKEEFGKEKEKLLERIEDLDKREALLAEKEKEIGSEKDKLEQIRKGLELEQKKLEDDRKKDSGYRKNVTVLANKMSNMPPEESVKIMSNWDDPLIIDVLRQMDADSEAAGRMSITSYLMTLFPKGESKQNYVSDDSVIDFFLNEKIHHKHQKFFFPFICFR